MKINQLKFGAVLTYMQMGLGVVINLLYTPVMIRCLGQSEYGLYQTALSAISMMSILNLGFSTSYVRYYAKYRAVNDEQSIFRLNGLLTLILGVLGVLTLFCGLVLEFNLERVFSTGLSADEYRIARVLLALLVINLSISFPASVLSSIITANERFVFLKLIGLIKTVLSPLVTLPLLLLGYRSIVMVSITVILSVVTDSIYFYYVRVKLKQRFIFSGFEKGLLKDMTVYTGFIAVNMIIDQINWNIPKIILTRQRGTIEASIFALGYTLFSYYMLLSTSISGVFTPRIHNIISRAKEPKQLRETLTDLFTRVGRIQFLILALVATGLIFFGKEFIAIWAGAGYERSYYVVLLLVLPASIALIQNTGIEIQRALNRHQFRSICYAFMALINFGCALVFCRLYGAAGAAVGTAVSLVVANGLIMNCYYHKKCSLNIVYFWKSVLRLSAGLIIPVLYGVCLKYFFNLRGVFGLLAGIASYTAVYCVSMWTVGMNDYEKTLITKPIRMILKSGKGIS